MLAVDVVPDPDGPGEAHEADLTTQEGNAGAVGAALERFGRLDAVVANAGFQHVAPIEEFPEDRWDALVALPSPFLLAKHAWPALGSQVTAGSWSSPRCTALSPRRSRRGTSLRSTACSGSSRCSPWRGAERGIAVAALCPGYVRTPLIEAQVAAQAAAHGIPEERVLEDVLLAPQARKQLLEPEEVAEAAAFLLGPTGARSRARRCSSTAAGWRVRRL